MSTLQKVAVTSSIVVFVITCWFAGSWMIAPSTPDYIMKYKFQASKAQVKAEVVQVLLRNPKKIIGVKHLDYGGHPGRDQLGMDPSSMSDSSVMYIFDGKSSSLLQAAFTEGADDWQEEGCELEFIGIANPPHPWRFERHLNTDEAKQAVHLFERTFLDSLFLDYDRE